LPSLTARAGLVASYVRVAKPLFYLGQASPCLCQLVLASGANAFDQLDLAAHTRAAEIELAGELLEGVSVALALQTVHEGMIVRIAASAELWPTDACAAARNRQVLIGHDCRALKRMLPEEQVDADPQTGGPSQLAWWEHRLVNVHSERKQYHGIAAGTHELRFKALQLACAYPADRRAPLRLPCAEIECRAERLFLGRIAPSLTRTTLAGLIEAHRARL
jgi:hypothetical protein